MRITGGTLGSRRLQVPRQLRLRPTTDRVREAVFNRLRGRVEGSVFVDLFAGTGAVGLEAVSRGARAVHWVEAIAKHVRYLRQNVKELAPEHSERIVQARVQAYLDRTDLLPADILWADPPYDMAPAPLLTDLVLSALCGPQTLLILEHAARNPVPRRVHPDPNGQDPPWLLDQTRTYGDCGVSWFLRD